jgi:hypothetical protein
MPLKEKARQDAEPIPNTVLPDRAESNTQTLKLQAFLLARRFPVSVGMAQVLAPMVFGAFT